jgi:hypothetical protein
MVCRHVEDVTAEVVMGQGLVSRMCKFCRDEVDSGLTTGEHTSMIHAVNVIGLFTWRN